ncbi:zinc metalloprotease HtpX [Fodinicurvata halophila]|uniref:Zinc metalloprotease HtpX n=1 Tax=Fodinicurvata halophila TaxID=1419723 RepID=A0ABV8UGV6_9PROT
MQTLRRHKRHNLLHSVVLITGMALIAAACAWTLWGLEGVIWALVGLTLGLVVSPSLSPELVLRLYRARALPRQQIPELHEALHRLAERAGLPSVPGLYYVPSSMSNAFSVGQPGDSALALTDGMLRSLTPREILAVLAHEISHIANNDLWIMNLADSISRLTALLSYLGLFLLALNLPLALSEAATVPWLLIGLLVLAPTLLTLMQLALSRTREYDADLDAAWLTGDPDAMASALVKLERSQGSLWSSFLQPGRGIPVPSLLRSHPPTQERIRRLMDLREAHSGQPGGRPAPPQTVLPQHLPRISRAPRWRWPGLWY